MVKNRHGRQIMGIETVNLVLGVAALAFDWLRKRKKKG